MNVWEIIAQEYRNGIACVVITVLEVRGSVPGCKGAKAVVTSGGLIAGTLGGGKIEAKAVAEAQRLLESGERRLVEHCWNLQRDVDMTCGGEMRFLFECAQPQAAWHIVIFGAGHVAQALVSVLGKLACRVEVIDTRNDWLERFPKLGNVTPHLVADYAEGVEHVTARSFVLCLSKGHSTDRPVLRDLLRRHAHLPFLGVIGSASKRAVLLRELREDGLTEVLLANLICPVGLPIGSNDPAEIAISITAQLLERREAVSRLPAAGR